MAARPLSVTSWNGYAARWAVTHGGFDPRLAAPPVQGWLRMGYGLGRVLARAGVAPGAVTATGLLLALSVPALAFMGGRAILLAAAAVVLGSLADTLDGAVAVLSGRATRLGYVYDSVVDRLAEIAWFAALWLVGAPAPLVIAAAALCWLHEYVRARATAAGMTELGVVTIAERPTRVAVSFVGLLMAGLGGMLVADMAAGAATLATAMMVLLGVLGLAQLLAAVHRILG